MGEIMFSYDLAQLQSEINIYNTILKLFLSFLLSGAIGFEREIQKQPAGLRTHILIALGSTILMVLSINIPTVFEYLKNGDPGRIAAQVVSGIGFLGAGAIIRLGVNIKGLTTAASIWIVSAIGLVIGAGMYLEGILVTAFALFTLIILDLFEKKIFIPKELKILDVGFKGKMIDVESIKTILKKYRVVVNNYDIAQSIERKKTRIRLFVNIPENIDIKSIYNELNIIEGVSKITFKEL